MTQEWISFDAAVSLIIEDAKALGHEMSRAEAEAIFAKAATAGEFSTRLKPNAPLDIPADAASSASPTR